MRAPVEQARTTRTVVIVDVESPEMTNPWSLGAGADSSSDGAQSATTGARAGALE